MTTFLGNSMGCSSAALLAADQSDHYDTPWEFKNRALAAALGHQRQQQQQKHWQLTTEEEKKQEKATTNLDEKKGKQCSGNGVEQRQNQQQKRLSFPNGNQKQRQKTQKEMSQKQQQPSNAHICCMSSSISESASSNFPLLGLMPAAPKHSRWRSHQEKRRPADTDVHYHSPPMASPPPLTVNGSNCNASAGPSSSADEFRPPLPAHNHSHQQNGPSHTRAQSLPQSANGQMPSKTTTKLPNSTPSSAKNSTSKLPPNSSANFRKSPSFCRQQSAAITTPAARLPAPPIATISSSSAASSSSANSSTKSQPNAKGRSSKSGSNGQQSIGQQPLRSYPLVTVGPGSPNTAKQVLAFCQQQCFTEAVAEQAEDLAELVHERMERTEAEVLLAPLPLGAHLLRRRPDHSLALSLRGTDGVLHIKLEHRQAQGGWVLGEGPRFGRVRQMLRAYRRKELPVRGAEQVRLGLLLRPVEVPSRGLLLL